MFLIIQDFPIISRETQAVVRLFDNPTSQRSPRPSPKSSQSHHHVSRTPQTPPGAHRLLWRSSGRSSTGQRCIFRYIPREGSSAIIPFRRRNPNHHPHHGVRHNRVLRLISTNFNSLSCLGLGLVQVQAAYQRNRGPMLLCVPGRALAAYFFWTDGPKTRHMAIFEGVVGVITAAGLLQARRVEGENVKKIN